MYTYEYPRAAITADIICTCNNYILLVKRKNDPFKDMLALPGGYFNSDTDVSLLAAASRELEEETGIKCNLRFIGYRDEIDRDPRDRTITFIFAGDKTGLLTPELKAGDDAAKAAWLHIEDLWFTNLAFDHKKILKNYFNVKITK